MSDPQNQPPVHYTDFLNLLSALPPGSQSAVDAVKHREAMLAKPIGSLGQLENMVEFIARWREDPAPKIVSPMVAIFAANHGIVDQGVSPLDADMTKKMVHNFTDGGAAISQICAQHEINLRVFELALDLPTGDITHQPAMDDRTCAATLAYGMEAIAGEPDLLCIGEMGVGNSTIAAALCAAIFGGEASDWVGKGSGVDAQGLARKIAAVEKATTFHKRDCDHPLKILARLGGREIAAMLGAIVAARHHRIPVIIDGYVATAAAAIGFALNPDLLDHCIFAHVSAEKGHASALAKMGQAPVLNLGMNLGEGTGAALAAVLVKTALNLHANMATSDQDTAPSSGLPN